ncbi:MAG: TonB-dependent receptor [Candidatus Sphingomonas colombiensis]|nr:TonB-dependent receptor plug domain-containing protein [Sphingomonas sp.]WEK44031.1 MAG: TonB-dependent receptor [Sphingomonas sp.]
MRTGFFTMLAAGSALIALAPAAYAQAGSAADDGGLPDIVVTATKQKLTLQEVPISVGVVSGKGMEDQGVRQFTDLQSTVPNLQIDNTNGNYAITIRGLGSGSSNLAFEQSVGLFVDGVYSSRARSLQVPFLDVERVEVVRGPQGALFGKNTNAGAISIITRRPTRNFEAEARIGGELAQGGFNASTYVSTPISDTLAIRLSGQAGRTDGYIDNRLTGRKDNSSKYLSGRAQVLWQPTANFEALLKVEAFRNEIDGSNAVYNNIGSASCNLCNLVRAASGGANAQEYPGFWRTSRGNPAETDITRSNTQSLTLNWNPADWNITSITAFQKIDAGRTFNTVPGGLPLLNTLQAEKTKQFSQEVRAAKSIVDGLRATVGVTYTHADTSILQDVTYTGIAAGVATVPDGVAHRPFDQKTWSLSPYAILDADLSSHLKFNGSLRYSYEDKSARAQSVFNGARRPANNLDYDISGERKEKLWDYSLRMRYEFNKQISTYLSYATGTKGGGFISNDGLLLYNINNNKGRFDFDSERARAWELGTKMRLLNRRLDIDLALFRTKFHNLQVSSYNGTAFITGNAAEATAQGVEIDTRFRPNRVLSMGFAGAYLDAKYNNYPGGPCVYNAPVTCTPATNNLAGSPLVRAPEWKGSGFMQVDVPAGDSVIVSARGSADYTSTSYMQGDLNPLNSQPAYTRYDARVGVRGSNDKWEVALVGRNLTSEVIISQAFNTPLLGNNSHVVMVAPPRTISIEARIRY